MPIRLALEHMLATHAPYPGLLLDRHWGIRRSNISAHRLLRAISVGIGMSLLDAFGDRDRMAVAFDNADEVRAHFSWRLQTESAHYGGDPVLERPATIMVKVPDFDALAPPTATIAAGLKSLSGQQSFQTVLAHFATTDDIEVVALKIKRKFPVDDVTKDWLTTET